MTKQNTAANDKNISENGTVSEVPNCELDGFNMEDFAINPTQSDIVVKPIIVQVAVRRPDKQKFFKVLPGEEWEKTFPILEIKEDSDYYLVRPEILPYLLSEVKYIRLHLAYYMNGNPFLLPVTLPDPQNPTKWNSWHQSMSEAVALASKGSWIRAVADKALQGYQIRQATGTFPEPVLPDDMEFKDYVKIAFKNHVIDTTDHPVVKQLLGLQ